MQFNYVTSPFMRALIRKYEFERDEAIANLHAFFENGVGVFTIFSLLLLTI